MNDKLTDAARGFAKKLFTNGRGDRGVQLPMVDSEGRYLGGWSMVVDFCASREAEAQRRVDEIETMALVLLHEINTPCDCHPDELCRNCELKVNLATALYEYDKFKSLEADNGK